MRQLWWIALCASAAVCVGCPGTRDQKTCGNDVSKCTLDEVCIDHSCATRGAVCDGGCATGAVCAGGACLTECKAAGKDDQACEVGQTCTVEGGCQEFLSDYVDLFGHAPGSFVNGHQLVLQARALLVDGTRPQGVSFELQQDGHAAVDREGGLGASGAAANNPVVASADFSGLGASGPATFVATMRYVRQPGSFSTSRASAPLQLVIDNDPPVIANVRAPQRAGGSAASFVVQAEISDHGGSGVESASLRLGSCTGALETAGARATGETWSFEVPLAPAASLVPGGVGPVSFCLNAYDKVKNAAASFTGSVQLDFRGPDVCAASQADGGTGPLWIDTAPGAPPYQLKAALGDVVFGAATSTSASLFAAGSATPFATAAGADAGTAGCDGGTWPALRFDLDVSRAPPGEGAAIVQLDAMNQLGGASVKRLDAIYDGKPPAIDGSWPVACPDRGCWLARDAGVLDLRASVSDLGVGLAPAITVQTDGPPDGGSAQWPCTQSPCLFRLNPAAASAGSFGYTIVATDLLGHTSSRSFALQVDPDSPVVSVDRIYRHGDPAPAGAGTFYPPPSAGPGYDGGVFLYNDVVQVDGRVVDTLSGVDDAGVRYAIDSVGPNGNAVADVKIGQAPATCADAGRYDCTFSFAVSPRELKFRSLRPGPIVVRVRASDRAVDGLGRPLPNVSRDTAAGFVLTRELWQATLGGSISGLALHPSGKLVASIDGGAQTLVGLAADGGAQLFAADAGSLSGAPVVGAGDDPDVYVANQDSFVGAFYSDGGADWSCATNAGALNQTPTVLQAPAGFRFAGSAACEGVFAASTFTGRVVGACKPDAGICAISSSNLPEPATTPLTQGTGGLHFGGLRAPWAATLSGSGISVVGGGVRVDAGFTGIAEPGDTLVLAGGAPSSRVYTLLSGALTDVADGGIDVHGPPTSAPLVGPVPQFSSVGALLGVGGSLTAAPLTAQGSAVTIASAGQTVSSLLYGADGLVYAGTSPGGVLVASRDGAQVWQWDPVDGGAPAQALALDCAGRLFVASGSTVTAFQTDAPGLLNALWPKFQHDARNSGSQAMTYGISVDGGSCAP